MVGKEIEAFNALETSGIPLPESEEKSTEGASFYDPNEIDF